MNESYIIASILVMAGVTYATRCLPLVLFRKKLNNTFWYSFLNYTPYGVLAALIFPAVFMSTSFLLSGIIGFLTAIILAFLKKGLFTVSIGATIGVFVTEFVINMI